MRTGHAYGAYMARGQTETNRNRILLWILVGLLSVILLVRNGSANADVLKADYPAQSLAGTWSEDGDTCKATLPKSYPSRSVLELSSIQGDFEVSVGDEVIYRTRDTGAATAILWIPLPDDGGGKELQVTGEGGSLSLLNALNGSSALGTRAALQERLFRSNFYALLFFIFSVIASVFVFYISIRQRHLDANSPVHAMGVLGAFILCSGIWAITDAQFLQFLTGRTGFCAMVSVVAFFLMPVFFLQFLEVLLPKARVLVWLERCALTLTALALFLQFTGILSAYYFVRVLHLFLVVMFIVTVDVFSKNRTKDNQGILVGCVAYFFCEITTLVVYYLNPTSRLYSAILCLGVVLLVISCLGVWFDWYLRDLGRVAKDDAYRDMAYRDFLTGLGNRAAYERDCERVDTAPNVTLVMFDINGLKQTNDTFGHAMDDDLIKASADGIRETFAPYGTIYRIGGDEFLALLNGVTREEAQHLQAAFAERMRDKRIGSGIPVEVACGAASTREEGVSFKDLYRLADSRMYENKKAMKRTRQSGSAAELVRI